VRKQPLRLLPPQPAPAAPTSKRSKCPKHAPASLGGPGEVVVGEPVVNEGHHLGLPYPELPVVHDGAHRDLCDAVVITAVGLEVAVVSQNV